MDKKIAILIRKFLLGRIKHDELEHLDKWFHTTKIPPSKLPPEKWNKVKQRMWTQISFHINSPKIPILSFSQELRSAVAIAAIAIIYFAIHLGTNDAFNLWLGNHMPVQQTYSANIGEIKELYLPDSTHVWLNTGSTLSYSTKFNKQSRKIKLSGQAYFDVTRDTLKPFIIYTDNSITQVLGTSFSIHSYSNETNYIIVTSGKVGVKLPHINKKQNYLLLPGDKLQYKINKKSAIISHNNATQKLSLWRYHSLYFESTSLIDIAATLERKYGIRIQFSNNNIKQRKFKGYFENPDLENVLRVIELSMELDIKKSKNGLITIKEKSKK